MSYRWNKQNVGLLHLLLAPFGSRSTNNSQCQSAVIGARNKMWIPHCRVRAARRANPHRPGWYIITEIIHINTTGAKNTDLVVKPPSRELAVSAIRVRVG